MLTRCNLHIYAKTSKSVYSPWHCFNLTLGRRAITTRKAWSTLLYRFHHRCRHCYAARIIVSCWLPSHKPTGGSEPLLPLCSRLLLKNWNTANSTVRLNSDANPCKSLLRCDLSSKKNRTAKVWCHVDKSGCRGDSQQLLLAQALCITLETATGGQLHHCRPY